MSRAREDVLAAEQTGAARHSSPAGSAAQLFGLGGLAGARQQLAEAALGEPLPEAGAEEGVKVAEGELLEATPQELDQEGCALVHGEGARIGRISEEVLRRGDLHVRSSRIPDAVWVGVSGDDEFLAGTVPLGEVVDWTVAAPLRGLCVGCDRCRRRRIDTPLRYEVRRAGVGVEEAVGVGVIYARPRREGRRAGVGGEEAVGVGGNRVRRRHGGRRAGVWVGEAVERAATGIELKMAGEALDVVVSVRLALEQRAQV